jgi:hypothetical protein
MKKLKLSPEWQLAIVLVVVFYLVGLLQDPNCL